MSNKPKQTKTGQQVHLRQEQHVWNYPVPPPQFWEKFKEIDPRIGDQFLEQWKFEAEHRRAMEAQQLAQRDKELAIQDHDVKSAHRYDLLSMLFSYSLILILFGATIFFAAKGMSIEAIGGILGTLALFLYKKKSDTPKEKS